jgi:hypothetical protein
MGSILPKQVAIVIPKLEQGFPGRVVSAQTKWSQELSLSCETLAPDIFFKCLPQETITHRVFLTRVPLDELLFTERFCSIPKIVKG